MPQLSPDFWALNFFTMWLLLYTALAMTTSLQLPLEGIPQDQNSKPAPLAPEWLWT